MYTLKFTGEGLADVKSLPKNIKNALAKALPKKLSVDPYRYSTELTEPLRGWRSFHWGKYRIVFKVYDDLKVIAIAGVGERLPQSKSDIYRKLEILANEGKLAESVLRVLRGFSSER